MKNLSRGKEPESFRGESDRGKKVKPSLIKKGGKKKKRAFRVSTQGRKKAPTLVLTQRASSKKKTAPKGKAREKK